jgi:hypothetical protein
MKKIHVPLFFFLLTTCILNAQNLKSTKPENASLGLSQTKKSNALFVTIHKEKDSPFEIYQDLMQDALVIRLKNQFDVLRFDIRDAQGTSTNIKGRQDRNEVFADLKSLTNGRYQLVVDRNNQKIFTEFFLDR